MTTTLNSPAVTAVLHRMLLAEGGQNGADVLARIGRSLADGFPTDLDAAELADIFKDVHMSVSPEGGDLLYRLARTARARSIVEFGTSFGLSAIYLACALRDNGGGRVITTELHPEKAAAAQRNFTDAGVADLIELRVGDARDTLSQLAGPIDLLLLDGWPDLALSVLKLVEPHLHPGSLIFIDDVDVNWATALHRPLLLHLSSQAERYLGVRLAVGDGFQIYLRVD